MIDIKNYIIAIIIGTVIGTAFGYIIFGDNGLIACGLIGAAIGASGIIERIVYLAILARRLFINNYKVINGYKKQLNNGEITADEYDRLVNDYVRRYK